MKYRILYILIHLHFLSFTQTFFEDFTNTQTGNVANAWLEKNLDGLTISGQISNYGIGNKAWTCVNLSSKYPEHGHVMCSTSWYIPAGTSNDWLISPPFAVSANSILSWEAMCGDKYNADGYEVRVSLGGVLPSDFTYTISNINTEAGDWKTHSISLNNFTNQIVRIAFVNRSTNKYLLFLDNVEVKVPIANDGGVLNLNSHSKFFNGDFQSFFKPFCGTIKNFGYNPISSAQIGFQLKHDTIVYENFQFSPPINYQETRRFCFSYFPTTFTDTTNNKLKAWTTMVNNVSETNRNNDTAKKDLYLPEYNVYSIPKADLLEVFGASNSEACASVFNVFDSLIIQKRANITSNFNVIKYQVESPPDLIDPSSNKFTLARKNYYQVNYLPSAIINGTNSVLNYDKTTLNYSTGGATYFHLMFAHPIIENGVLTGTLNFTSLYNLRNESPIRAFIVLNQKHYTFENSGSSQKEYYQVLRTMIPDEHGHIISLTAGTNTLIPISHTLNFSDNPKVNSEDFWDGKIVDCELIAFAQDTVTKEILQSASIPLLGKVLSVKSLFNANTAIFPNPANNFVFFTGFNNYRCSVEIFDINGRLILSKEITLNDNLIDTENFTEGLYLIKLKSNSTTSYHKILIAH